MHFSKKDLHDLFSTITVGKLLDKSIFQTYEQYKMCTAKLPVVEHLAQHIKRLGGIDYITKDIFEKFQCCLKVTTGTLQKEN